MHRLTQIVEMPTWLYWFANEEVCEALSACRMNGNKNMFSDASKHLFYTWKENFDKHKTQLQIILFSIRKIRPFIEAKTLKIRQQIENIQIMGSF